MHTLKDHMPVFVTYNFFDFFWNVLDSKTVKVCHNIPRCLDINFPIQSSPMSTNISILVKIYYICPIPYFIR